MKDLIWHPYTRFSALKDGPLPTFVRGEGPYLYDEAGHAYFDAISSWWACSLGHGHPAVVRAIQDQAARLQHSILGNLSHPPALALAERLSVLTGGERRIHFASDGSSAVEAALKIAVQYWTNRGVKGRTCFASLSEPYHGDTLGAVSVGYMEPFHRPFRPLLFKTHALPFPDCTACNRSTVPDACTQPCFAATEAVLREHAAELAGVIVEPLCQGAAGIRMYGAGYLRRLAALCEELEILLIVDEIATGFCKTGAWFAHQHAGIDPDLICMGKGLSAGYLPISAVAAKASIYTTFADTPEDHTFYHGHTYAGNPIAAAAALAAIRVYEDEGMNERAKEIGARLAENLTPLRGRTGIKDVRVLGLFAAIELDGPDAVQRAQRIRQALFAQRILVRPLGGVVYVVPPLIATDAQIDELCAALS